MSNPNQPTPPSSRAKYLKVLEYAAGGLPSKRSTPEAEALLARWRSANHAQAQGVADPRARYLRLLQAWVECLPHQPAKRRFVEGALVRARGLAVRP